MLQIENIKVPFDYSLADIRKALSKRLREHGTTIKSYKVIRESVDARKKPVLYKVLTLRCDVLSESKILSKQIKGVELYHYEPYNIPDNQTCDKLPPVVVGAGPAGLFGALILARAGAKPVLIEAGKVCSQRQMDIDLFMNQGILNPQSNIQFGIGGAGMFSDGKLNTGTKDMRHRFILNTLIQNGAPESIGILAKPHVGSDYLGNASQKILDEIQQAGGTILTETSLEDIEISCGKLTGIVVKDSDGIRRMDCHRLMLALGHSAEGTIRTMYRRGLIIEPKAFSVGVRIEHLQMDINCAQYGEKNRDITADYKLYCHLPDGRGVYTFCMCPGGYVVPATSHEGSVVTNGMSYYARDGRNSNSALLVSVTPEDFENKNPLAGFDFQRGIEQKAFNSGGGNYFAPAQRLEDFMAGKVTKEWGKVLPTYRPGVTFSNLTELFPYFITDSLQEAIPVLAKKLKGFDDCDAVLTAPETRSSSPCRIVRDENGMSSVEGIYPAGEGSGYAGGIMSSAADGIRCAERMLQV